jgi:hypothetical protein
MHDMDATYAISWRQDDGSLGTGRLELGSSGVTIEGRNEGMPVRFELPYQDVCSMRLVRANGGRLLGLPTLVLDLMGGETISIASIAVPGAVLEIVERLAVLDCRARCPA